MNINHVAQNSVSTHALSGACSATGRLCAANTGTVRALTSNLSSALGDTTPKSPEKPGGAWAALAQTFAVSAEAAAKDRQAGVGIRQGLSQMEQSRKENLFLQALAATLAEIKNETRLSGTHPSGTSMAAQQSTGVDVGRVVEQLGAGAQGYLLDAQRGEILRCLSSELGIDLSQLSAGSLIESVLGLADRTLANGAPAAAQTGSSAAVASKTPPSLGSSVIGAVGAAYSAYQLISSWGRNTPQAGAVQGAAVGGYIGSAVLPGIGTLVGTALGAVVGGALGFIKTGKHHDQLARDAVRAQWQKAGIIDGNYTLELADHSRYDIGLDGGKHYQNLDGGKRRAYEVDMSNPLTAQMIGWAQPLAALLTGGDQKLRTDFTGYLVNAAQSNSATDLTGALANLQHIYSKLKISPEQALAAIEALGTKGMLSKDEVLAYAAGFVSLVKGEPQLTTPPTA